MNDFSLRTSHSLSWYGSAKPSHTPFTKVVRHLAFTSCKHYISPTPPLPPLPRFIAAFRLLKRKIYQIGTSTDCAENSLFASWKRRVTTYEPFPTLGHVFSNFEHRSRCWNDPYCTAPLHSVTVFSFSMFTSCQKGLWSKLFSIYLHFVHMAPGDDFFVACRGDKYVDSFHNIFDSNHTISVHASCRI